MASFENAWLPETCLPPTTTLQVTVAPPVRSVRVSDLLTWMAVRKSLPACGVS
jgi:hypothetical protein